MLLRLDGTWVLADFGSASRAAGVVEGAAAIMRAEDDIRRATTPAYRAPEMWDLYAKEPIDYRVDLWVRAAVGTWTGHARVLHSCTGHSRCRNCALSSVQVSWCAPVRGYLRFQDPESHRPVVQRRKMEITEQRLYLLGLERGNVPRWASLSVERVLLLSAHTCSMNPHRGHVSR